MVTIRKEEGSNIINNHINHSNGFQFLFDKH